MAATALVLGLLNVSVLSPPLFQKLISVECIRRFDVVNKGYSGYNTSQILKILEHLIPPTPCAKVEFLVGCTSLGLRPQANNLKLILLGSNDSCLPTSPTGQHVPLDKYRENLKKIISDPSVTAHNPTILLVTPPPVNEVHLEAEDLKKGYSMLTRHQSVTAQYAEAVRELAAEFKDQNVLLADLWAAMMREGVRLSPGFVDGGALLGSKEKGDSLGLRSLLVDGIHLTGNGYALLLEEVMPLVATSLAEGHVDSQPWVFP
jgi:lysophospholipase L1-like esterase